VADAVSVVPLGWAGAIFLVGDVGEHAQLAVVTAPAHAPWAALCAVEVTLALLLVSGLLVHGTHAGLALFLGVELAFTPFLAL